MPDGPNVLMAMFQGGGNIPLLLPIVAKLVSRGCRVRVMIGPGVRRSRLPVSESLMRSLDATGAQVIPLREPDPHPWEEPQPAPGLLYGWTPAAFISPVTSAAAQVWMPHWASEVTEELQRAPADILVSDFVLLGALVAAEAKGVPSVALFHTVYTRPISGRPPFGPGWTRKATMVGRLRDAIGAWVARRVYARDGLPMLNQTRTRLGMPPLREYFEQYDRAARALVLTSQHFEYPDPGMPPNVRLVGTPLDAGAPSDWEPPWSTTDQRPRVLVSLSTLPQGQAPLMERVLLALGELSVDAIVTLGPALTASQFDPPANVVLETFVPHNSVMPHVDAVVTQCGIGTLMRALKSGVPLVCIPLVWADQPDNAARIVALGAGLRLSSDATTDRIRDAIQRVIEIASFRDAAQEFAAKVNGEDPAAAAVDEIISAIGSAQGVESEC